MKKKRANQKKKKTKQTTNNQNPRNKDLPFPSLPACTKKKKVPLTAVFKALSTRFTFLPQICLGYACLGLTALGVRLDGFQNRSSHNQCEVDLHWPSNPWDAHMVACEEH